MNSAVDRILYSTQLETGSVVYGSEYPFDHCKGLLYLTNKLLSFFPLHSPDGMYFYLFNCFMFVNKVIQIIFLQEMIHY